MTTAQRRKEERRNAADFIRREGALSARLVAEGEVLRSVMDVGYPFGRVGFYRAVLDLLDGPPPRQATCPKCGGGMPTSYVAKGYRCANAEESQC